MFSIILTAQASSGPDYFLYKKKLKTNVSALLACFKTNKKFNTEVIHQDFER